MLKHDPFFYPQAAFSIYYKSVSASQFATLHQGQRVVRNKFKCKLLSQKANVYGLLLIPHFYFHASLDSRRLILSYRTESCQSWIAFLKPLCLGHNPKCRPKTYQVLIEGHPYFQAVSIETKPWIFIFPAFKQPDTKPEIMSADYPYNPHFGRPTAISLCLFNRRILIESHASIQAVSTGAVPWVFIFRDINNLMPKLDT